MVSISLGSLQITILSQYVDGKTLKPCNGGTVFSIEYYGDAEGEWGIYW